MFVEIITPDKKLFSGEARIVQLPGTDGSFELLENHAAIISNLAEGNVRLVFEDKHEELFAITGGVVESANNKVIVLAE